MEIDIDNLILTNLNTIREMIENIRDIDIDPELFLAERTKITDLLRGTLYLYEESNHTHNSRSMEEIKRCIDFFRTQ